jgi:hypothetical protein
LPYYVVILTITSLLLIKVKEYLEMTSTSVILAALAENLLKFGRNSEILHRGSAFHQRHNF